MNPTQSPKARLFVTDIVRCNAMKMGLCLAWSGVIFLFGGCANGNSKQDLEKKHEQLRSHGGAAGPTGSETTGDGGVSVLREMAASSIYTASHGERLYVESVSGTGAKPVFEQRRVWKTQPGSEGLFSLEISQPRKIGNTQEAWKPARTLTFGYGAAGEVELRSLVDHEKMTSTRFDPPLVMLPASIKVGQTHEANTSLVVLDLKRDSRVIDRGKAAVICTLTTSSGTPVGTSGENLLLQTSMTFDIGPATVLQERGQALQADTGGLVGELERLRVNVGIITIKRDERSWTLVP